MRYRTIGLAAAVLLAAPLMSSCRNPRPPGGGPTTTKPAGGIEGKDCGVISPTAPNQAAANCFNEYHSATVARFVKVVHTEGANTITDNYQAHVGHNMTVTQVVTNTATGAVVDNRTRNCQVLAAQVVMTATGPSSIITNCTIPS